MNLFLLGFYAAKLKKKKNDFQNLFLCYRAGFKQD